MTTKLYMYLVGGVSGAFILCVLVVAAFRLSAIARPARPAKLPANAVWRTTPSESARLLPHGDWVACKQQATQNYCLLTDHAGVPEYQGAFVAVQDGGVVPQDRLSPITSESISPWMWSAHANRLVPLIQLEDGTVLVPVESTSDLKAYVERVQKFNARLKPAPIYLEYHPAGTPPSRGDK